jgi:hypothetical protein
MIFTANQGETTMIPEWNGEAIVAKLTPEGFVTPCGCVLSIPTTDWTLDLPLSSYRIVLRRSSVCDVDVWEYVVLFDNKALGFNRQSSVWTGVWDGDKTWEDFYFRVQSELADPYFARSARKCIKDWARTLRTFQ